jgi:hypothetical protein
LLKVAPRRSKRDDMMSDRFSLCSSWPSSTSLFALNVVDLPLHHYTPHRSLSLRSTLMQSKYAFASGVFRYSCNNEWYSGAQPGHHTTQTSSWIPAASGTFPPFNVLLILRLDWVYRKMNLNCNMVSMGDYGIHS